MLSDNKVALIMCPCWGTYHPPLATASLSAVLRAKQVDTQCFDINIGVFTDCANRNEFLLALIRKTARLWHPKYHAFWWDKKKFARHVLPIIKPFLQSYIDAIVEYAPKIAAFTIYDTTRLTSLYVASELKKRLPDIKIIFGGPDCLIEKRNIFVEAVNNVADVVAFSEGEEVIVELAQNYFNKGTFGNVAGTMRKQNNQFVDCASRDLINDLDAIPFPDYSDFDLTQYSELRSLPLAGSRGCVANCTFCGETFYWGKYRARSVDSIIAEMKHGRDHYKANKFITADSLLNASIERLEDFADTIIADNINIDWGGYLRVHPRMDHALFLKLKKAGCSYVSFGIESGCQKIIDDMKKGFSVESAAQNLKDAHNAGILTSVCWIIGFPTETFRDFLEGLGFIWKTHKYISQWLVGPEGCNIIPHTELDVKRKKYHIANSLYLGDWHTENLKNTVVSRSIRLFITRVFAFFLRINTALK